MGSETLPSACYILSDETSIPFYSMSNGYKKFKKIILDSPQWLLRILGIFYICLDVVELIFSFASLFVIIKTFHCGRHST